MSTAVAEIQSAAPAVAPQIGADSGALISMIARAASDPSVSIDKMERLFAMHKEMEARQAKTAYQAAMAAVQAEIGPIIKDRHNPHAKSMYATLEAVDATVRPIYTRHGFSLSFDAPEVTDKGIMIACDVLHAGGHSERKTLVGALDTVGPNGTRNKTDIQGMGSTVSYVRRYLTCMIFNVVIGNEDRDGRPRNDVGGTITAAEYENLTCWLDEVQGDPDRLASLMGASDLTLLSKRQYADAVRRIEGRARELGVTLSKRSA